MNGSTYISTFSTSTSARLFASLLAIQSDSQTASSGTVKTTRQESTFLATTASSTITESPVKGASAAVITPTVFGAPTKQRNDLRHGLQFFILVALGVLVVVSVFFSLVAWWFRIRTATKRKKVAVESLAIPWGNTAYEEEMRTKRLESFRKILGSDHGGSHSDLCGDRDVGEPRMAPVDYLPASLVQTDPTSEGVLLLPGVPERQRIILAPAIQSSQEDPIDPVLPTLRGIPAVSPLKKRPSIQEEMSNFGLPPVEDSHRSSRQDSNGDSFANFRSSLDIPENLESVAGAVSRPFNAHVSPRTVMRPPKATLQMPPYPRAQYPLRERVPPISSDHVTFGESRLSIDTSTCSLPSLFQTPSSQFQAIYPGQGATSNPSHHQDIGIEEYYGVDQDGYGAAISRYGQDRQETHQRDHIRAIADCQQTKVRVRPTNHLRYLLSSIVHSVEECDTQRGHRWATKS